MRRLVVTEPTEISLNNQRFLLEAEDEIILYDDENEEPLYDDATIDLYNRLNNAHDHVKSAIDVLNKITMVERLLNTTRELDSDDPVNVIRDIINLIGDEWFTDIINLKSELNKWERKYNKTLIDLEKSLIDANP